jgi:hypothetical protein
MILSDLRNYLQQQRRVVLADLVNHFDMEPDAIRGMLNKWISKGKVKKISAENACGTTCCKCDPVQTEIYEWLE